MPTGLTRVLYGAGSSIIVDFEETCRRLGCELVAVIANVAGETFTSCPERLLSLEDVTENTHSTYRAIKRGKVLAAPTDSPVMQGRIAIDQAVRALEGSLALVHAGPAIQVIDQSNVDTVNIDDSLAPPWFKPTFEVKP